MMSIKINYLVKTTCSYIRTQLYYFVFYLDEEDYGCLGNDTYIFIGNGTSIEKCILNEDTAVSWETLIEANSRPLAFDVDIDKCILFYSVGSKDTSRRVGEIYAVSLRDHSTTKLLGGLGYPKQIAVNWITRKIYWCDAVLSTIEYTDFNGNNRKTLVENADKIEAIVLDPCTNELYWISKLNTFVISKMKLDGTDRQVIVSSNILTPNSLIIDYVSSRMYWTDFFKIHTSDLEGEDSFTVYRTQSRRPTAIAVYRNMLYWAEWKPKRIATCTTNGENVHTLVDNVIKTAAIHVLDRSRQLTCCE